MLESSWFFCMCMLRGVGDILFWVFNTVDKRRVGLVKTNWEGWIFLDQGGGWCIVFRHWRWGGIFRSRKKGNGFTFLNHYWVKFCPGLYPIQSNMGLIFYPIWMNPGRRCVCSHARHAGHCFLSMCWSLRPILFQPSIRHLVFINAKRDARCARFVYVNICIISWINTLMTISLSLDVIYSIWKMY